MNDVSMGVDVELVYSRKKHSHESNVLYAVTLVPNSTKLISLIRGKKTAIESMIGMVMQTL